MTKKNSIKESVCHATKHLDEDQLMSQDCACRFCGSKDRAPLVLLQEDPSVWLLECRNCRAASASRIPTPAALEDYYDNYYCSDLPVNEQERITFDDVERFAKHICSRITKYLNRSRITILDFGGGDGSIAVKISDRLLKMGIHSVDILLVDYNDTSIKPSQERISLTHRTSLDDLPGEKYDFVIASAIIEHIPEPGDTLVRLMSLLNDEGIFYARTPYVVPFVRLFRILGLKWDFTYPGHLHDIGPDFWTVFFERICEESNFEIILSEPSIVQTSLRTDFFRTVAAYTFKAPWYMVGDRYRLVGGWEVFVRRHPSRK